MSTVKRPVMRYHGGKWRLANWIVSHFPTHRIYVEPFGGAASVLMKKPRCGGEVYNDLDGEIVNVMRVLQDPTLREQLAEILSFTPYARMEFKQDWEKTTDPVEQARRTLIRAEMGFSSAGATRGTTGFRLDTKRNHGTAMRVWAALPDKLAAFTARLRGVLIENRPALQVLRDHDTPGTLFYLDPPYIHATRKMSSACYRHEMDNAQHRELLTALLELEGMVVLSGYSHPLYDDALKGWRQVETQTYVSAQSGSGKRTEVLWLSPNVQKSIPQPQLSLTAAA
jgi:DNA adenine methylase